MKSIDSVISLLSVLLLTGCGSIGSEIRDSGTRLTEEHLLTAGFKIMIADTEERQEMMNALPPESLSRIQRPEGVYYIYADPDTCACLYVGRNIEYQKLQQLAIDRQISNQALVANEIREDYQSGWGVATPWGFRGQSGWGANPDGNPAWDPQ